MERPNGFMRVLMPVLGVLLSVAAAFGLVSFVSLLLYVGDGQFVLPILLDFGLVALCLICVLVAGLSLIWSSFSGRSRDLIPGATLYLLGLFLLMLGVQAMLVPGGLIGIVAVVIGALIIIAEYRLDVL